MVPISSCHGSKVRRRHPYLLTPTTTAFTSSPWCYSCCYPPIINVIICYTVSLDCSRTEQYT